MPAIYLFQRRTILGGDDLQPVVFLTLSLRLCQLSSLLGPVLAHIVHESRTHGGFLVFVLYDFNSDPECRHTNIFSLLLVAYALATVVYGLGSLTLEWRIARWSSVGSPTEPQNRSTKVTSLLELKLLPFTILLALIWIMGICAVAQAPHHYRCERENNDGDTSGQGGRYLQSSDYDNNEDEDLTESMLFIHLRRLKPWWVAFALLLLTQFLEVIVYLTFLIHLLQQPRAQDLFYDTTQQPLTTAHHYIRDEEESITSSMRHELAEEMWADRCASACQCLGVASCFMFGGREVLGQADFGDVARALADYLETRGVLDVVPSDVAAGFLVLQRLQRNRVHRARQQVVQERLAHFSGDEERSQRNGDLPESALVVTNEGSSYQKNDLMAPLEQTESEDDMSFFSLPDATFSPVDESGRKSVYRFRLDHGMYERQVRAILSRSSMEDMASLEEGARYAKYALAIYTWVLYLYVHPATGVARLAAKVGCRGVCRTCNGRRRNGVHTALDHGGAEAAVRDAQRLPGDMIDEHGRIDGDNACETHKAALLLTAGLQDSDLAYALLRNGFRDNPYCILLDHKWRNVVVSIRGTFSLEDCVTDVLIEPESLEQLGHQFGFDGENQYCHGGVLLCVRNVYRDLQRHGLLDKLLLGEDAMYPDYSLRLVGHSLGAATCVVLSYMLKPKFPSLRCVAYCPPGHSLSWGMAVQCKDWCTTFVLDSDIVPRLSVDTMEVLRDEILELIGRIKVPKIEIARRLMKAPKGVSCSLCFDPPLDDLTTSIESIDDLLHHADEVPHTEYRRQLERFKLIQEERRQSRGAIRSIKLFPPGKMVHLIKTGERRSCFHGTAKCLTCFTTNSGFLYTPVWINNDDLNEIVVSAQMGTDHFPNRMAKVIDSIADDYGLQKD